MITFNAPGYVPTKKERIENNRTILENKLERILELHAAGYYTSDRAMRELKTAHANFKTNRTRIYGE